MDKFKGAMRASRVTVAACACVMAIILAAGLWPFHQQRNDVAWLSGGGIRTGRYGSLVGQSALGDRMSHGAGSVEVLVRPVLWRKGGVILSFDSSGHPLTPFLIRQVGDALVVQQPNAGGNGVFHNAWLRAEHAFRGSEPVFLAVVVQGQHTRIYVDGILARDFAVTGSPAEMFSGRLLIAGSPNVADTWTGEIRAVTLYNHALSDEEIAGDYRFWTREQGPYARAGAAAFFNFREGSEDVAHDQSSGRVDLTIPSRFFVLHPVLLRSPMSAYRANWPYWQDVLINIVGFIPFGFCFFAYLSHGRGTKNPLGLTIALGFLTSLTIELLQFFLPTRDSGATDLITNTFGTAVGAGLCRWSFIQGLLQRTFEWGGQGEPEARENLAAKSGMLVANISNTFTEDFYEVKRG